jgi:putative NADH-flavin reductase
MNLTLFGASGATGKLLTERALDAGHHVTALVRSPQKFPFRSRVQVVQGSAFDPEAALAAVRGAEVVLSALGAPSPFGNHNVLPRAIPNIVDAMQQLHVRRIIVLGSAGALSDSLRKQPAWRRWIVENIVYKTFLKWPVREQISQYSNLSTSGLDWTMVMPPMLTNGPAHGSFRVDGEALPPNGSRIARADVADFMMQQLGNPEWVRKGVYISY